MSGPLLLKQMVISPFELFLYLIGYIATTSYMFFAAYQTTRRPDFRPYVSPDPFGILVDQGCESWQSYLHGIRELWWVLVTYIMISKALRQRMSPLLWSSVCGLLSAAFVFHIVRAKGCLFLLAIVGSHVTVALLFRSRLVLWVVHVIFFILTSTDLYDRIFYTVMPYDFFSAIYSSCALVAIRCLMFLDDALRLKESTPLLSKLNVCTFLHYVFYPPTMLFGPIYTIGDFKKSLFNPVRTRYFYSGFRALRLTMWGFLLHISFYIHYRTFLKEPFLAREEDSVAFAGSLYLNGIRFYLLYVSIYGWPNVLGHIDGFELPDWPRCISNIYSYAEMWKVFDRGLYNFIKNYIYIPLGGNLSTKKRVLSSAACFMYVVAYHGLHFNVFIWVFMNSTQIVCEVFVVKFYYSDLAKPLHVALSPAWTRRLFAALGAWTFMFSCLGFFYFDIGYETTNFMMKTCGSARFWVIFFAISYFLVQLAIECRVRGFYQERRNQPVSSPKELKRNS